MTIKEIFVNEPQLEVTIHGWIISNRGNSKVRFVTINDGSTFLNLQVVIKDEKNIHEVTDARLGSPLTIMGVIKKTPEAPQPLELVASSVKLHMNLDEDYPLLQKQAISKEVLREIPHLRHRSNLFRSVMRIRSTLAQEVHQYFTHKGFLYVNSPILTSNDGEGAGETFVVDDELKSNFFNQKATLGVTGQLHAEAYANGFGNVYTFAPTFRAEKSHTQKHLAEFWMIEPEMAFVDQAGAINLADDLLRHVVRQTLLKCEHEIDYLTINHTPNLKTQLSSFLGHGVQKLTYGSAIEILKENAERFVDKEIFWGKDLATEHERFLAEEYAKGPIAITDYPKEIKAFYMKLNPDEKTVACFDILVPGIGELVGGSERETNLEKIGNRLHELNIPSADLQWYLDIRKYGHVQSSGFGIGFERLVMFVSGVENIRDVIPFPRVHNSLKM